MIILDSFAKNSLEIKKYNKKPFFSFVFFVINLMINIILYKNIFMSDRVYNKSFNYQSKTGKIKGLLNSTSINFETIKKGNEESDVGIANSRNNITIQSVSSDQKMKGVSENSYLNVIQSIKAENGKLAKERSSLFRKNCQLQKQIIRLKSSEKAISNVVLSSTKAYQNPKLSLMTFSNSNIQEQRETVEFEKKLQNSNLLINSRCQKDFTHTKKEGGLKNSEQYAFNLNKTKNYKNQTKTVKPQTYKIQNRQNYMNKINKIFKELTEDQIPHQNTITFFKKPAMTSFSLADKKCHSNNRNEDNCLKNGMNSTNDSMNFNKIGRDKPLKNSIYHYKPAESLRQEPYQIKTNTIKPENCLKLSIDKMQIQSRIGNLEEKIWKVREQNYQLKNEIFY